MDKGAMDIMLPWRWYKGIGKPRCPLCFGNIEDLKAMWRSDEDHKRLRFTAYCSYCDETLNLYCGSNLQMNAIVEGQQLKKYAAATEKRNKAKLYVKNGPSPTKP